MASGVRAKIGTAARGSQAQPATPCRELFREMALGGRLLPGGIKCHLFESQAHRLIDLISRLSE